MPETKQRPAVTWTVPPIRTWAAFQHNVRSKGCTQLASLPAFTDPILVAGCQRSGTTMLTRIITAADTMVRFQFGIDDELDAGCILCGAAEVDPTAGRFCFQTTYLNECVGEYFEHQGRYKLVWVIRNPVSVIRSMTRNWSRSSLNRLFNGVALGLMNKREARRHKRFGALGINRFRKACLAYAAKSAQVFDLTAILGPDEFFLLDYDRLVQDKHTVLPELFRFLNLEYDPVLADRIHGGSLKKGATLGRTRQAIIERTCQPVYEKALALMQSWHGA